MVKIKRVIVGWQKASGRRAGTRLWRHNGHAGLLVHYEDARGWTLFSGYFYPVVELSEARRLLGGGRFAGGEQGGAMACSEM